MFWSPNYQSVRTSVLTLISLLGLRVWRTNPGSVFDYDPAEDNIQSRSLHMINGM